MKKPVVFYNSSYENSSDMQLYPNCTLFHGKSVDDRGVSSIKIENENISQRVLLSYNYENMQVSVGNKTSGADDSHELFTPYMKEKCVVLEATTLGFSELFFAIKSLIDSKIKEFLILYVEPRDYSREKKGSNLFALSELNAGYKPIPKSIIDLASTDVVAGVFFLGYESERIERAMEDHQMLSSKEIKVVFGIPAFQPGWELNSIVPHLELIENFDVAYCAANDPDSAYDVLEETRLSLDKDQKMFVAPIGTKPCSIASAIFASLNPSQVGVLYDHRKKKNKRSEGVHIWHRYSIII